MRLKFDMRLSLLQRIKRRIWLLGGSYTHRDGTIELDIDEKAGIDPTVDDEATQNRKFDLWNKREQLRELRGQWFFYGVVVGGLFVYWWLD